MKLNVFFDLWGLLLNMTKSKLVAFRRSGIVKNIDKWYSKGHEIDVGSMYKYSGLIFTTILNWSVAKKLHKQIKRLDLSKQ